MLTGMLAARNIALGEKNDLWGVNADQEYQEQAEDITPLQTEQPVLPLQDMSDSVHAEREPCCSAY